jgi:hypothetical protein
MKNLYIALKTIVESTIGSGEIKRKPDSDGYYTEPLHKNELEYAQEALAENKEMFETDWSTIEPGTLIKVRDWISEPWFIREFHSYHWGKIMCRPLPGGTRIAPVEWRIAELLTSTELELERHRAVLKKLLAMPEAKKALDYLHSGLGTPTESAAWLEAETLINQG